MAKDVYDTLLEIICEEGNKTHDEAEIYLQDLQKNGRYLTGIFFIILFK